MRDREIRIQAEDTEPLEIFIDADGISDLTDFQSGEAYFWEEDAAVGTNHIDGATVSVSDSDNQLVSLDPIGAKSGGGNAFDTAGTYYGYVKITWSDTDITRHPGNSSEYLKVIVVANRE